jgi:hypothetical protein
MFAATAPADDRLSRFAGTRPPLAFAAFVAAAVGVVPASTSESLPLAIACASTLVGAIVALVASILVADRATLQAARAAQEAAERRSSSSVWGEFELAFRSFVERRGMHLAEKIHSLQRSGGRAPLLVLLVTDRDGRLVDATAYDPDDYC